MDAALGWIGSIVEWLGMWIPSWVIVQANEGAIKFRRGKKVLELLPGVRWYWPPFTAIEGPIAVTWQTLSTKTIPLTTKDGKPVIARGIIRYRIEDLKRYLVDNCQADEGIEDEVAAAIRDVVTSKTFSEIQENARKTTDNALEKNVRKSLEHFGIDMMHVRLVAFAEARILNVSGDTIGSPVLEDEE